MHGKLFPLWGSHNTIEDEHLAKSQLASSYEIKDLGKAKFILEMQIDRNAHRDITLS